MTVQYSNIIYDYYLYMRSYRNVCSQSTEILMEMLLVIYYIAKV